MCQNPNVTTVLKPNSNKISSYTTTLYSNKVHSHILGCIEKTDILQTSIIYTLMAAQQHFGYVC